jgi:hypothetical protein
VLLLLFTNDQNSSISTDTAPVQATRVVSGPEVSVAGLVASIARLIAELAEVRVISDRRAEQLVSQAETISRQSERVATLELETTRLRAELIAGNHRHSPGAGPQAPEPPAPTTDAPVPLPARLRALAPWLVAVLATALVVLLAWLR